ncbi:hypothetical protein ACH5RR_005240 [Cinchona calisaya]|uniref:Uncharacterized protein n=1 Tax=Cinchona calisaya TaxID=153742 RepID=A0ABD3AKL8_9GENT
MNSGMQIISPASYLRNSSWLFEEKKRTKWTQEENKKFENALALFDKDTPDRWYNVAAMIPGKTVNDVIKQYRELVEDVSDIEAGLIPIPPAYSSGNSFTLEWVKNTTNNCYDSSSFKQFYGPGGKRNSDHERKKGVPWTEEEHRQFLLGLKKYGKGDWRNISRNFVATRTPTQVASHAQKYFIRQLSGGKDKRRSSIHDITTVNLSEKYKSPSPDDKSSSSSVMQPPIDSNINGISKAFYNNYNTPNQGATMAFNFRNSGAISTPQQGTSYGQKHCDCNIYSRIALHGFQFGDQNTVFQM